MTATALTVSPKDFGTLATAKPKYEHIRVSSLGSQDVRFIAKDGFGCFTVDGREDRSKNEMEMQIIYIDVIECKDFYLFNDNFEKYSLQAEVLFLDEQNKLSSIFLKTQSLDRLVNMLKVFELDGVQYQHQRIKAKATAAQDGEKNKYFFLDFEHIGDSSEEVMSDLEELFTTDQGILFAASRFRSGKVKVIPRPETMQNES